MLRRVGLAVVLVLLAGGCATRTGHTRAATRGARRVRMAKAVGFLAALFDPELNLLPEYAGASDYWLVHDNYLAAGVLRPTHPDLSQRIRRALAHHGVTSSGKIEIVRGEAEAPLPFRIPELVIVATAGGKRIKTERLTARRFEGWQEYADLLLLAALAEAEQHRDRATEHFRKALAMWDGMGFNDRAAQAHQRYSTYKLALAMLAAGKLEQPLPMRDRILTRLAHQQHPNGGFVTDYDVKGRPVGLANVETTCLVILALRRRPAT